jgi:SAM-dependent methyltransferase
MAKNIEISGSKIILGSIFDYDQVRKDVSKFYDRILPKYDLIFPRHRVEQRELANFLHTHFFKVNNVKKILDIACGNGALLNEFSQLGEYDLYGMDASPRGIDYAKSICRNGATLKRGDWLSFKGPRRAFDAVLCTGNSIAHLPPQYLLRVMKKFSALLRPGGLLIVDVYSNAEWNLSERQKIVPRSCIRQADSVLVVAFTDQLRKQQNIKFTMKSVNIMRFGLDGLPINYEIESFETVQFVVKYFDLFQAIKKTGMFKKIKRLAVFDEGRFTYLVATKK